MTKESNYSNGQKLSKEDMRKITEIEMAINNILRDQYKSPARSEDEKKPQPEKDDRK